MSILNFVTQDDLDNLDEDPRVAFMQLVNLTQRSLSDQTSRLDGRDEAEWEAIEELRHSFMNVIVAAAKRFGIEPFLSMQVPTYKAYRNTTDHREFRAELDHYVTQLILDNSVRRRSDSVAILPATKDKIRDYIRALRECVEKSSMSPAKREALLQRLGEFEAELEKRRTNLLAVMRLTFELLAIPGGVWASVDVAHRLVNNVLQTMADAKSAEQETHQIAPAAPPKALSPPRMEPMGGKGSGRMNDVIDEDIPF